MVDRTRYRWSSSFEWWGCVFAALLVGLLLLQYVLWIEKEEVLWWPETIANAKWTLFFTGLVMVVPRLSWRWRWPLLTAVLIALNAVLSHARWLPLPSGNFMSYGIWLGRMFAQLTPFVWFSVGSSLAFVFAFWWGRTKPRIYAWMIVTILFFCIRDSFSTLVLWPQVAMVLFCGLLLLILRHFAEFQKKAPKSWEHIAQYPSAVILPIVAIMAVTILLGVLTPTIRPLLTDPYTLWKHAKGEPVLIAGKGEISDWVAPAQDTSSGYGRNDRELGGGFRFDYSPVFTVDSPERSYWRGETRSVYTGSGWELSEAERRAPVTGARVGIALKPESRIDASQLKTKQVVQTYHFKDGASFPVLFAARTAQHLQDVNGGTEAPPVVWAPEQSELRFRGDRASYPKEYTVVSQMPVVDVDALKAVTYPADIKQELPDYLQLPPNLPQRVRELALQVTQSAATPYEKVKLLEQYLATNYQYTNTPDLSKGRSKDFVDRFLFEIKEGYCDYYSSALVVMARSLGLPARWVKGYSTGTNPLDEEVNNGILRGVIASQMLSGGTFTVRNSDAHSWVEVYFPGYGWIPFEPTSGFAMPMLHPEQAAETAPAADPAPVVPAPADTSIDHRPLVLALSFAGAAILLAAIVYVLWKYGAFRKLSRAKRSTKYTISASASCSTSSGCSAIASAKATSATSTRRCAKRSPAG
ncbi:transglutaminase family protein [Gordoniibacillus kamchatkensis]|uniref:transglutaminase family protein n=1 Tax=Gordoniibacillus kamchatkensis TaxID=1590651 RepID=UPI000695C8E0|nr:transglutaminase domain-containing protein [Paenibacillus sp. VKM B-2647]